MKNSLLLCLTLICLSSCGKENDVSKLGSNDMIWAPYTEGQTITYVSEDGNELEAVVIEVVSNNNLHTNVIDLGEIGKLHIEVVYDQSGSKVEQFLSFEDFISEPLPGFIFNTDIEKVEDNPLGILMSLKDVTIGGNLFLNVVESRVRVENNGILTTYLSRDGGLKGFDDVHDTGVWVKK